VRVQAKTSDRPATPSARAAEALRLSEDAAFRRVRAAKIARQFLVIFQQIADGELQLSTLLLLGSHVTEANYVELLALAKYRTKREVLRLVCGLHRIRTFRTASNLSDRAPSV